MENRKIAAEECRAVLRNITIPPWPELLDTMYLIVFRVYNNITNYIPCSFEQDFHDVSCIHEEKDGRKKHTEVYNKRVAFTVAVSVRFLPMCCSTFSK